MPKIAEVLLPVPLSKTFDYWLATNNSNAVVGQRVLVEFGNNKEQVGVIVNLRLAKSSDSNNDSLKTIIALLDDFPVVDNNWYKLINFASRYYAQPLGKSCKNAFPKLLRVNKTLYHLRLIVYFITDKGKNYLTYDKLPKNASKQRRLLHFLSARLAEDGVADYLLRKNGFIPADTKKAKDNGLIAVKKESPYLFNSPIIPPDYKLNDEQQLIVDNIVPTLGCYKAHLIYGVTGSGKTEIYINLIRHQLLQGKQVLLLVPEISLTPQMLSRFTKRFGRRVVAYHSGITESKRRDVFLAAQSGELPILIGTRSAIFVPLSNLGLIVVDEEHDLSYKQQKGFLYNARDLAIYQAKKLNINIVFGSATPSLESIHNVDNNKLQLHILTKRATNSSMPDINIIDRRGQISGSVLSASVIKQMRKTLQQKKQVLLFLNRRGFAPVIKCNNCKWVSGCPKCSVMQTAHVATRKLCCHHCGHVENLPMHCPDCNSSDLYFIGCGTQKLESQINKQFPKYRVLRLDRDKQKTVKQLNNALIQVQNNEVDIILGTQLVVKGHHFPNVELVCVVDADSALFSSDFRAVERLHQQLIQVSGRAGRESKIGKVLIQSSVPDHDIFFFLMRHDYWSYAQEILKERKEYQLPPQTAVILVKSSAFSKDLLLDFLHLIKKSINKYAKDATVLGPVPAAIEKIKNRYQIQIWLSFDNKIVMQKTLPLLQQVISYYDKYNRFKTVIDVDAIVI